MNKFGKSPLVSVGIPTYNRPDGLVRTLESITHQSYKNLEIIISDNCSPGTETINVVKQYIRQDNRIKYYNQSENRGSFYNFEFVLEKANGDYFMWAADDDEWDLMYIYECMKYSSKYYAVTSYFHVNNRSLNTIEYPFIPQIGTKKSVYLNSKLFINNMCPNLFYAVYNTKYLKEIYSEKPFDWLDCYYVLKLILINQLFIIPQYLYIVGIDTDEYITKPSQKRDDQLFRYSPIIIKSSRIIINSNRINIFEKIELIVNLFITMGNLFINFEQHYQVRKWKVLLNIKRLINKIGIRID
jgi:glycosyltransferase involved in cell wall biosynthesis